MKSDRKIIAETACILANKALNWKARALAAEEALSKFSAEVYRRLPEPDGPPSVCANQSGGESRNAQGQPR